MTGLSTLTLFRAYQRADEHWRDASRAAATLMVGNKRVCTWQKQWEAVAQRRARQANRFERALVERFERQQEGTE